MTVGELIVRLGADISELDKALQGAETKVQRAGLRIGDIFKTAIATAIGFSLADVGRQIINFAKDITMTAGRTQALEYAMLAVADAAGYGAKAALDTKKALQEANIAEQEAIKITTRLMQAQIDLAYAIKLSKIAQDAAIIANMGSSEAAERLVEAIATQRTELLDVFGFTKNLNDIMRDYTATIGKNVNQLTEYDRRMAMLNYILQEGQKIAGAYDRAMSAPFKRWGSFVTRILPDFKSRLGEVMLPLFDLIVTGLSNAVKSLSAWIEQNKTTLIAWGRTFANVISQIWTFLVTAAGIIARQWNALKPIIIGVVWAFVSFKMAAMFINAATWATNTFAMVMSILRGEAVITSGVMSIVSRAIQIYRLQLHLASMSGITHLGVIQSLRVALYSLWTALGPLGWAIIGVSAALTAGIGLWMKYVSSVEKANLEKVMEAQNKQFADSAGYTKSAADNMGDLSDKTKKASKAAHDNLQSFDEIHSVMEDISSTEPQMPELGEMGGLENLGDLAKMPGIDLSAIEQVKPTLAGFWDWIKQGFANAWDWVKEKTSNVWNWLRTNVGNLWERIKENWEGLKELPGNIVERIKTRWENFKTDAAILWDGVKTTVVTKWEELKISAGEKWEFIKTTIQGKWNELMTNAPIWWQNITTSIKTKWDELRTNAGIVWDGVKTAIQSKWNEVLTNAPIWWGNIKTAIQSKWDEVKTSAGEKWELIKSTIQGKWEEVKTNAPITWDNIKGIIQERWETLKTNSTTAWNTIKSNIANPMEDLKKTLPTTWGTIATKISDVWEGIKKTASDVWGGIVKTIKQIINKIIEGFNTMIKQLNKISFSIPSWVPVIGGMSWGFNLPTLSLIPLAKGGVVTQPTPALIGEAGPEAVIPLSPSSPFIKAIHDAVYEAIATALSEAITQSNKGDNDKIIILEVNGRELARATIEDFATVAKRMGIKFG